MTDDKKTTFSMVPLVIGTGQALLASLGASLILATCFYFTDLSDTYTMPVVHTVYALCSLWAGWAAARKAGGKGLIYGCLAGLCFFILTWLIGYLVAAPAYPLTVWWKKLAYAFVSGAAGGMAAVAWRREE
ncbi:MAG: TIGR04086 family membrane protein [Heliobacteriaceae bacterium]|nr:TIGR04086 family membrane protein [Heliobacteriaceae bacterium]MDD4586798.1 TIGR04086 family membrane protein [Heliobacteriaceae bacterium]